ncbi:MAG: hypothetical protein K6T73_11155, partial [Candidatus Bathyarchaeota archaeon]|nr:hypothetical protein [Candidatus Bathyarchaeota archaeon]
MSVSLPHVAVIFGGDLEIPESDVVQCRVYLGCTREVSSFELLLQNWGGKYSPGGAYALSVGMSVDIFIGRVTLPKILTGRIEGLRYVSSAVENYVYVSGRCVGEKLYRKVVTKKYSNINAKNLVIDLLDNFVGLPHTRSGYETVEDTSTVYTNLEYENTPVIDILRFVADSADWQGVIGYDFRVAPDGIFEFFLRNSKTSSVSLSDRIEEAEYRRDIHRIRNKVTVYGVAEKAYPPDRDFPFTEAILSAYHVWEALSLGNVYTDSGTKTQGSYSIKHVEEQEFYYGSCRLTLTNPVDSSLYPTLNFFMRLQPVYSGVVKVELVDVNNNVIGKWLQIPTDKWVFLSLNIGAKYMDEWEEFDLPNPPFNWAQIKRVKFVAEFPGQGTGAFWVDKLYFNHRRYSATAQDTGSQSLYGLRELVDVDEELYTDDECSKKANALLAYLKNPAEYLTVKSTVIDYGNTPILAGDKIHVTLPNENVNANFRVLSAEYLLDAKTQTLEITLELGREPQLFAGIISNLFTRTETLARTKTGGKVVSGSGSAGGGGGGVEPHGDSIHTQFNEVDPQSTDATKNKHVSNLLAKGWEDHKNASAPHVGHATKPHGNEEHSATYITQDDNARVKIRKNGVDIGVRRAVNLIEGSNVTLTLADDAVNEEVDVTIAASGGGGGSGSESFVLPLYLGESGVNIANKVLAGSGGTLAGVQYYITRSTLGTSTETRGFYPEFRHVPFKVNTVKYDRMISEDSTGTVRIYIDKIAPDGTITNLYDSGDVNVTETSWTSITVDLSSN